MESKKAIRNQISHLREQCTEDQVKEWSHKISKRVISLPAFRNAKRIMAYVDCNHEVMTNDIIEEAWKTGKEVAVPKVYGKKMRFHRLKDFSQLEEGYMGIMEPVNDEVVHWEEALMIMPGVAFDRENHRIGYGGGFYDRFLEEKPQMQRVAVAFDFQMLDSVPSESTDICPHIIITEKETCYLNEI